ncbi:hypothetical protein F5050DRAFT_1748142 [Lentinula boryana]|uniref:Reverse transcriptase domain-containing protein n=1 Tax=Lentinula boryana TaxID=40481 RepID=A0ABQ8QHH7_9AGAR|nr:hypothetical protein F5050DRAFT_1748142 [Lentinula boryana]
MDDFADLQEILDKWCLASGAKFNVAKTQIIPIGAEEYRTRVLPIRNTDPNCKPLPEYFQLAKEGEVIWILGAWYGNNL